MKAHAAALLSLLTDELENSRWRNATSAAEKRNMPVHLKFI